MSVVVVITTVGEEQQAILLARELVARRHAACVNIVPGIRSVYRWQGKICRDGEFLLVVKTLASEYDAVVESIRELHSYELPEILSFPVDRCEPRFLQWVTDSLDKAAEFSDEDDEAVQYADLDDREY